MKLFILVLLLIHVNFSIAQSKPVALVIGQNDYLRVEKLKNAISDSKLIANVLESRGFEVQALDNANLNQIKAAIQVFKSKLSSSKRGIIYYAGHGVQIGNENYLIPIDLTDLTAEGISQNSMSLNFIIKNLESIKPESLTIILDACRDNPFLENQVSSKGLGEVGNSVPNGFLIIYGASAGQLALDGGDPKTSNGLFALNFSKWLSDKELSFSQIIRRTRVAVLDDAKKYNHEQLPSVYNNLERSNRFPAGSYKLPPRPISSDIINGPVKIILPFAANSPIGKSSDFFVKKMQEYISQPVIAENIIDIKGLKVTELVGNSPQNGQTLLVSSYQQSLSRAKAGDNRLIGIGLISESPLVLMSNAKAKINNINSLIKIYNEKKLPFTIGISGPGGPSESCANYLKLYLGEKINIVRLNGQAAAVISLFEGKIDLYCDTNDNYVNLNPALNISAVTNFHEDALPDYRPVNAQAQGYAMVVPNWSGLFVPAGTSPDIIKFYSTVLQRILDDSTFQIQSKTSYLVPPEKGVPLEIELSLRVGLETSR